jgi:glycosyltransferase involved in cell wall biosynthesis
VSVIIPTYNRARFVAEAVASTLAQTWPPNEVIVVDDGSTDDTQHVLAQFGPPVVVVRQPNRGVSAARNRGMEIASSEVILFLDSDDLLLPHCIARSLETLDDHPDVDVVYSDCYFIDSAGNRLGVMSELQPGNRPRGMVLGQLGYSWFLINISATCVRRSALREIKFEENGILRDMAEDFEFWRRLATHSRFHFLDEILACYRFHSTQVTATRVLEVLDGAVEVQQRIMAMPQFNQLTRGQRARLYCHHGVKQADRGQYRIARSFFARSVLTTPTYLPGCVLFGLSLLGARPLRFVLGKRRQLVSRRLAAAMAQPSAPRHQLVAPNVAKSFPPFADERS